MKKKPFYSLFILMIILVLGACSNQEASGDESTDSDSTADYPDQQIELVIHASAGGSSDTVGRAIAKDLEESLGTPVVAANKTGGSGAVAFEYITNSNADGYTIGFAPIEISMLKAMGHSEIEPTDFDLLARAYTMPATITVHADAPYDTIQEFVDYAKENPGEVKMANSGTGAIYHIAGESFAQETGIEVSHIPFDGGAPAVTALMGKNVDAVAMSPMEVKAGVDGGDLKVLGVMAEERHFMLPDVLTMNEQDIEITMPVWGGFSVPKGTPEDVKEVLANAIEEAILSDEFAEIAETRGLTVDYLDPQGFEDFAMEQFDFFSDLIPKMELDNAQ